MKKWLVLLALALVVQTVGCLSWQARHAPPMVRYYAALADYNQGKLSAAVFVESTPLEQRPVVKAAVLKVVKPTDAAVKTFELLRQQGPVSDGSIETIISVLERASDGLAAYAASKEER